MAQNDNLVFLSYSRSDAAFALKLATDLRQREVALWIDQLDIPKGERWDQAVEDSLVKSKVLMVILSPEAVSSNNVMDEVSYALEEGKLVLPVLLSPCKIPFRLRRIQYVDFTNDYEAGFSQLLKALRMEHTPQPAEFAQPTPKEDYTSIKNSKKEEFWNKLVKMIAEKLAINQSDVVKGASFVGDLGADELDLVELIMSLEEEFNLEISDEEAEKLLTVGGVYEYGIRKLGL